MCSCHVLPQHLNRFEFAEVWFIFLTQSYHMTSEDLEYNVQVILIAIIVLLRYFMVLFGHFVLRNPA